LSLFVDTSMFYAAATTNDAQHVRAKRILGGGERLTTTDHVLGETWALLRNRLGRESADSFWSGLRRGVASVDCVQRADLEVAWDIGEAFPDQDFSLVDRTSFAVMQRLGLTRAASFDHHFAVFRYGPDRRRAFQVLS
jgi:uncharacterized protein